jgi:hypothetical protein
MYEIPSPIDGAMMRRASPVGTVTRDGRTARMPNPTSSRSVVSPRPGSVLVCANEDGVTASAALSARITSGNREVFMGMMLKR